MDWMSRNKKLVTLGFTSYADYLASPRWTELKRSALEQAERRCQLCDGNKRLQVHHRSYKRIGTNNEWRDLVVLCKRCHVRHHGFDQPPTKSSETKTHRLKTRFMLSSERELAAARAEVVKADAKATRQVEEERRQEKELERKRLAKQRDWRDERRLLNSNLVYREDVPDKR
jgi:hypothetical protein